jgi:hypothetical protein
VEVTSYFAGLDLGQASEHTALAVLAKRPVNDRFEYAVRHLQRWQPGTPYHGIAADVGKVLAATELGGCHLIIDRTGVGRAATALFEALAASVRSIVISAGHAVTYGDDGSVHVPKKELVAALQVLLQGRRFQVASRLPLAETLLREMESFKAKIMAAGSSPDLSWREREHDDLVLAAALAAWDGERTTVDDSEPMVLEGLSIGPSWRTW